MNAPRITIDANCVINLIEDVRVHDLRHSAASNMVNAGQSLFAVQKVLGHRQARTTQIYAHLAQDTLVAAADAGAELSGWL